MSRAVRFDMQLGVPRERINTLIDFQAGQKHGTQMRGTQTVASQRGGRDPSGCRSPRAPGRTRGGAR